jgi:hypothetical protein
MTSPTNKWVQRLCVADMWVRPKSTLTDQLGLGLKRALAGSGWAGLGRAGPDTWQAVALPHHSLGPHWDVDFGCGRGRGRGSRWTASPSFLLSVVHVHRFHACVAGEGIFPCFLAGVFPLAMCSPTSFRSGTSAQLSRGKILPGLDDCDGGV